MQSQYQHSSDIKQILCDHNWNAGLQFYDFLLSLSFRSDGTGERVYGEAQAVRSTVPFHYEILEEGQIRFTFTEIIYGDDEREAVAEIEVVKVVGFEVTMDNLMIDIPYQGPTSYHYCLCFTEEPFPDGPITDNDNQPLLSYYV